MKKLAIISSYNESCGNASYTHVLRGVFAEHVEVEVIPLDIFILQKQGYFYKRHGDRHIKAIAKRLAEFDYVNIQFEAGLFGPTIGMAFKRICILIQASKNLILTMHRIDPPEMTGWELLAQIIRFKMYPKAALRAHARGNYARLYESIIRACKAHSRWANIWIAVHTRREGRIVKDLYGFNNVFNYPITFLQPEERAYLQQANDPTAFRQRHQIPDGVKVVGAFGFVSKYKGYETLLKTLTLLPEHYHIYIFGGQHPQSVKPNVALDPYFQELIDMVEGETKAWIKKRVKRLKVLPKKKFPMAAVDDLLAKNLLDRVHFMGGLSDPEFIEALHFSDYTVLPYLEVGQSMSGVISLAIESSANLFCSTNLSFNEVRKYFGDVYHTFDIGNYVELAQKLQFSYRDFTQQRDKAYQQYNIRENVRKHLQVFGHSFD